MSALAEGIRPRSKPRRKVSPLWMGDTVVYLILAAITWSSWKISSLNLFKAGDDVGYWLGVAGGVMMLLLFVYPLRKHFKFAQNWGHMKWWFWFHMVLGIGGPWLILVHSTFRVGSLNAGVALYSMVIVAISGVIGRFIYRHVNKGLRGEEVSLKELQVFAGMHMAESRSLLAFAPEVEDLLKKFESDAIQPSSGWSSGARQIFWLPILSWLVFRRCDAALMTSLNSLAKRNAWTDADIAKHHRRAQKFVRNYLHSVVGVAHFTAYEHLFALWHVAHIPFVYLLVISSIVHVVAVHAY